jgi:hypothetical protein
VKSYIADNVPFNSANFRADLQHMDQTIDFSGVGAHHQNGIAERSNTYRNNMGQKHIDCYVDADFAGLWPFEDKMDPVCVKSRTEFVICISDCPIVWTSKLQSDIALSTMESEYTALSTVMREVIPLHTLFKTLGAAIGINQDILTSFRTTIHEDNAGTLTLANMEPGRVVPCLKPYAVKMHWFHTKLKPNSVVVVKIDTTLQRADLLTKGLRTKPIKSIQQLLCGW